MAMKKNRRTLYLTVIAITLACLGSCSPGNGQKITRGIAGTVLWFEGNLMPGPDQPSQSGKPVVREIHIYELTKTSQTTQEGSFYTQVSSRLVKKVKSDKTGHFTVELLPGRYSIFCQEEEGLYANMQDGEGHIQPVTVEKEGLTPFDIRIDYKAVY